MCALSEGSQIKTNPFLSVRFAINLISLFIENQGDGGRILIRPTEVSLFNSFTPQVKDIRIYDFA